MKEKKISLEEDLKDSNGVYDAVYFEGAECFDESIYLGDGMYVYPNGTIEED